MKRNARFIRQPPFERNGNVFFRFASLIERATETGRFRFLVKYHSKPEKTSPSAEIFMNIRGRLHVVNADLPMESRENRGLRGVQERTLKHGLFSC
jgi:hypothetical protein